MNPFAFTSRRRAPLMIRYPPTGQLDDAKPIFVEHAMGRAPVAFQSTDEHVNYMVYFLLTFQ
jgi:hypothetical protein